MLGARAVATDDAANLNPVIKVLLVDDDLVLAEVAKEFLEMSGKLVIELAGSAKEGLHLLEGDSFDALVCDYEMPNMTGIDLLIEIRASGNDIPFILFTGKGRESVVIDALNHGADSYLQKGGDPSAQFAELEHKVLTHVERLQTRSSLIQSEDRYRSLFLNMHEGFAYCKMLYNRDGSPSDFVYLSVNKAFDKISGTNDVIGRRASEVFPGIMDDYPCLLERYGRVSATGESETFDLDFAPVAKWLRISAYSMRPGYFVAVFIDITEIKRAESSVREERDRLSALVGSINDEIWFSDEHGNFTLANPKALQEFVLSLDAGGLPVKELASRVEVLRPDGTLRPLEESPPLRALRGEIVKDQEEIVRIPSSGERRFRQVNATPVVDNTGTIMGVVSVVHDITEQRRTEAALLQANKELNLLTRLTRHDIMNQMISVEAVSLRLRKTEISDSQSRLLGQIESSVATVKHQLEFTKTYQEIGIQKPIWQDLWIIVASAASSPSLGGLEVKTEGADHEIFADPLFEKVFFEILDNSVRHGLARHAVLSVAEREKNLEVRISDDGTGIPDEVRPRLFEYGRGNNSGLGLYLCRDILATTEIGIEEKMCPGNGARFTLVVPQGYWRRRK